jgi:hypothetical protein
MKHNKKDVKATKEARVYAFNKKSFTNTNNVCKEPTEVYNPWKNLFNETKAI